MVYVLYNHAGFTKICVLVIPVNNFAQSGDSHVAATGRAPNDDGGARTARPCQCARRSVVIWLRPAARRYAAAGPRANARRLRRRGVAPGRAPVGGHRARGPVGGNVAAPGRAPLGGDVTATGRAPAGGAKPSRKVCLLVPATMTRL